MNISKFKQTEFGEIPEGWISTILKDVAVVNEKTIDKQYPHNGIEYIDIASVDKGRVLEIRKLLKSEAPSRAQRIVRDNDILLSTVRPNLKHFAFMKTANPDTIASTGFAVISSKTINPRFLYYYLTTDKYTDYLSAIADTHTSTYPAFNPDILENSEIPLPPENEQHVIAKILSALDDKIELNHQMNKTLESIAQAIFKRWFVEFEFPGYEKNKFVNGLPDGWSEGKLVDVCDIVMGQSPPGNTYNESGDGVVFYQGNRDFGFRFPTPRVYCTAPTRLAEAGDVLISVRAPVGALNITLEQCAIGRGVAALRMKHYSNGFLFYFLSTRKDLWDRFNSEGTVFGCLNKTEFQKVDLVIPSDMVMEQFDTVIKPIEAMIRKNEAENRLLVKIRDSLLPRLMSGRIRVNYK